eukprot:TRINITY_DN3724_c0_g1_i1.p1 TRINITY_DN3724_c0_g1~~TRINITY_DN3724_c0_g1_i1.p1  ORF type:complete len:662 (-),score=221.90 TRINITY_DN3724_c0_g1_i1:21-2006(-)
MIGVCTREQSLTYYCGGSSGVSAWSYYGASSGYRYHNGSSQTYGKKMSQGDHVKVVVDMDEGWIQFGNGTQMFDKAYTEGLAGLSQDLYPCVSLYDAGDSVTFKASDDEDTDNDETITQYGLKFTVEPAAYTADGAENMWLSRRSEFEAFIEENRKFNRVMDQQLVELATTFVRLTKPEGDPSDLEDPFEDFKPSEEQLMPYRAINHLDVKELQTRLIVLQIVNDSMSSFLPLVDLTQIDQKFSLANDFSQVRGLVFLKPKLVLWEEGMSKAVTGAYRPNIRINRQKTVKLWDQEPSDTTLKESVFGQIGLQLANEVASLRQKPDSQAWHVDFDGESSIDAGGPYRETFTQVITEIQSPHINLLIPVPNSKSNNTMGQNRDKFIPNPSLTSDLHKKYYHFLGKLIGCGLHQAMAMDLRFPSLVWKKLVNFPVTRSDLEAIDITTVQCNDYILHIDEQGVDAEMFGYTVEERFQTTNSDGKVVELVTGGSNKPVTFDNRKEWVELVESYRLSECDQQIEWIREGLNCMVPTRLFSLMTWQDLQVRVCGVADVSLATLRAHTSYSGLSRDSDSVKYFWEAMERYSAEDRQNFLRFVWGRSRLPVGESYDYTFIIASSYRNDDQSLPISHTCSFQLDLPTYSSADVMYDRLKYAFTYCADIDND